MAKEDIAGEGPVAAERRVRGEARRREAGLPEGQPAAAFSGQSEKQPQDGGPGQPGMEEIEAVALGVVAVSAREEVVGVVEPEQAAVSHERGVVIAVDVARRRRRAAKDEQGGRGA